MELYTHQEMKYCTVIFTCDCYVILAFDICVAALFVKCIGMVVELKCE